MKYLALEFLLGIWITFHPFHARYASLVSGKEWDCNRPWPELELFLPVALHSSDRQYEWQEIFLRSYLLFWPVQVSKTKLLFVIDEEQKHLPNFEHLQTTVQNISFLQGNTRIISNEPSVYYGGLGSHRQQYLMFYADNFTNSEYVGFVDTDCLFVTYIDREDVFEYDETRNVYKPVVNGKSGNPWKKYNRDLLWHDITATTYEIVGVLEPMKCMSYFPVVIKTSHIRMFRDYLEKRFAPLKFYDIYLEKILPRRYSQFNLFCAYLFAFHQDDYAFYAHDLSPEWDFRDPSPVYGQENDSSKYSVAMRYPKPRVATHARYHSPPIVGAEHTRNLIELLQAGICLSPPFDKNAHYFGCGFYRTESDRQQEVFEQMHQFEWSDFTAVVPHYILADVEYTRYTRLQSCNHTFYPPEEYEALITFQPSVNEGDVVYAHETGKQLYLVQNDTIRGIPNWDTYCGLGLQGKPNSLLSHRMFKNFPKGEMLPSMGRRKRRKLTRKLKEEALERKVKEVMMV